MFYRNKNSDKANKTNKAFDFVDLKRSILECDREKNPEKGANSIKLGLVKNKLPSIN